MGKNVTVSSVTSLVHSRYPKAPSHDDESFLGKVRKIKGLWDDGFLTFQVLCFVEVLLVFTTRSEFRLTQQGPRLTATRIYR